MNIDKIIAACLDEGRRRIIVPGFGAFIRRSGGEVAFVDILNTDDGVLAAEVQRREGVTGDEARTTVDKYAFHLKTELLYNKTVVVEGVGIIRMTSDGSFDLDLPDDESSVQEEELVAAAMADLAAIQAEKAAAQETAEGSVVVVVEPDEATGTPVEEPEAVVEPNQKEEAEKESEPENCKLAVAEEVAVGEAAVSDPDMKLGAIASKRTERELIRELLYGDEDADELAAKAELKAREAETEVAQDDAEKPAYRSNRYNFGGEQQPDAQPEQQETDVQERPQVNLRKPKKKRVDMVVIIAVIALLVAAAVLIYGEMSTGNMNFDLKELINRSNSDEVVIQEVE